MNLLVFIYRWCGIIMPHCCVPECNKYWTKDSKVTFHRIPRKYLELQRAWLARIKSDNLPPLDYSYVCSDHFTPDCFENDLKAKLMPKTKFKGYGRYQITSGGAQQHVMAMRMCFGKSGSRFFTMSPTSTSGLATITFMSAVTQG